MAASDFSIVFASLNLAYRRIIERDWEDAIRLSEDMMDAELAAERWHSMDNEGSVPWEDVKKELCL